MKKILAVAIACVFMATLLISAHADNMQYSGNKFNTGDVNGDGVANMKDVAMITYQFNMNRNGDYGFGANQYNPDADLNKDGVINMADIAIVIANFNHRTVWHLVNYDWEVIAQTQYWTPFILWGPNDANVTFDNKGNAYFYLNPDGIDWTSAGLHQGSKPFYSNSSYTYPFVPEDAYKTIDCCAMIDHVTLDVPIGSSKLRMDIWLHAEDQQGHTGEVVMTIDFDERGYGNLAVGDSKYYEQSHNGNTWLCFEYRLGSMNDGQWYDWTLNVYSYIMVMKAFIAGAPSSWQWIANSSCSVRDIDMSMEAFYLVKPSNGAAWIMDYCYFYANE